MLEEAYEKYPKSNLGKMADKLLEYYPERHRPGNYVISNLKDTLRQKDECSRFFNTLPNLDPTLKKAMMLKPIERHDYKLVLEPKNFDSTLAAVQWEMNIEEGLMYGILAFSTDKGIFVTPEQSATGDYSLKARTGGDGSQLALVNLEADKRLKDLRKIAKEKGATVESLKAFDAATEYVKKVRNLNGNILIQTDLGGNAAWRSNQANHLVNGPMLQKPIMLARGQVLAKGGMERFELTMARMIEEFDSVEKGNPNKQGGYTCWNHSNTEEVDKKTGKVVKGLTAENFHRFGMYNDAEILYSHCVDRSDHMPDNKFFKFDYVNLATERMIADDNDLSADILKQINSGNTSAMNSLISGICSMNTNLILTLLILF